ncbi:MAG: DUF559 domain-containing protein [Pseudomonadota bacterium]
MPKFTRTKQTTRRARTLRRNVSKTEHKLWPYLRGSQMTVPFRRQDPVEGYFLDYACIPLKLGIEIDGPWHSAKYDARRDETLKLKGWTILRFSVQAVDEELDGVLTAIGDMIHNLKSAP